MDSLLIIIAVLLAAVAGAMLVLFMRRGQSDNGATRLEATIDNLAVAQTELTGRLSQLAESSAVGQAQLSERLQAQERAVTKTLEERLADLTRLSPVAAM